MTDESKFEAQMPRGKIKITDPELIERMRKAPPNLTDKEAAQRYRELQVEQLMRMAKRAGFL